MTDTSQVQKNETFLFLPKLIVSVSESGLRKWIVTYQRLEQTVHELNDSLVVRCETTCDDPASVTFWQVLATATDSLKSAGNTHWRVPEATTGEADRIHPMFSEVDASGSVFWMQRSVAVQHFRWKRRGKNSNETAGISRNFFNAQPIALIRLFG